MTDARTQAIAQRRNLLNIIRELEADSVRCLKHAEALRRVVNQIERGDDTITCDPASWPAMRANNVIDTAA